MHSHSQGRTYAYAPPSLYSIGIPISKPPPRQAPRHTFLPAQLSNFLFLSQTCANPPPAFIFSRAALLLAHCRHVLVLIHSRPFVRKLDDIVLSDMTEGHSSSASPQSNLTATAYVMATHLEERATDVRNTGANGLALDNDRRGGNNEDTRTWSLEEAVNTNPNR